MDSLDYFDVYKQEEYFYWLAVYLKVVTWWYQGILASVFLRIFFRNFQDSKFLALRLSAMCIRMCSRNTTSMLVEKLL